MAVSPHRIDWDDLRLFLAVARLPSLRLTAEELGLSAATLSRHIAALEGQVGAPLFVRRSRGLELSREGESLLTRCEEIERIVGRAADAAAAPPSGQEVRVACLPALTPLIAPALPAFHASWPDVTVALEATSEPVEADVADAEISIRLSRPSSGRFTVRRLATLATSLYAHVDAPPDPPLVLWGAPHGRRSRLDDELVESLPGRRVALVVDDLASVMAAIGAGLGAGVLPDLMARGRPDLARVPDAPPLAGNDAWMIVREEARRRPAVRDLAGSVADAICAGVRGRRHAAPTPALAVAE